jgi:hypothetical protein
VIGRREAPGTTVEIVGRQSAGTPCQNRSGALVELVVRDRANVMAFREFGSEDDLVLALVQPWTAMGTDWGAPAIDGPLATNWPHPRAFGTTDGSSEGTCAISISSRSRRPSAR